jgi:rRNA maturation protein Rpf1
MWESIRRWSICNHDPNRQNVNNKSNSRSNRASAETAITTSRRASPRVKTFAKELAFSLNAIKINRGKASIEDFLILSRASNFKRVIFIDSLYGNPSRLRIYDPSNLKLLGLVLIKGVSLWREIQSRIRFRPRGVVLISEGDPIEHVISNMLNIAMVKYAKDVPQGFGAISLMVSTDIITLRFIHVKTLRDFGPIIRIRSIIKGEERVFGLPIMKEDRKN